MKSIRLLALAAAFLAAGSVETARADDRPSASPLLREAQGGEVWITQPTLSGTPPVSPQAGLTARRGPLTASPMAVSYEAMTEFARRYPSFGLSQRVYQSSDEWDYDFQNVPELRTRDFWSDSGGMLLYWTRYEMAAAAIAKIEREHPGFHRAFNAEYFRRLSLDPRLTVSRDLVKDIVRTVAPTIEGRPAAHAAGDRTPAPTYQWQVSTNAGSSWTNLADGAPYAGAQMPALALASVTVGLNAHQYRAVASNALGAAVSATATLSVSSSGQSATSFYPLTPCRAFDSRSASGPDAAAPALDAGVSRVFPLGGRCGIPGTATALSVNVTVAEPKASGYLVLYPGDESVPVASTVSFRPGQTRANNAIIKIAGDGSGTVGISNGAPGPVHFILDVNGYFE